MLHFLHSLTWDQVNASVEAVAAHPASRWVASGLWLGGAWVLTGAASVLARWVVAGLWLASVAVLDWSFLVDMVHVQPVPGVMP